MEIRAITAVSVVIMVSACDSVSHPPTGQSSEPSQYGIVKSEFISQNPSVPFNHASTIAETRAGLISAWHGGMNEGNPQVVVWVSRCEGGRWSEPLQVADGIQADGRTRYACWNPVLFQVKDGPLLLFYKVGPGAGNWWGMLMTSIDNGLNWSLPRHLPDGYVGPVRNKPVQLQDGSLLCGSSTEITGRRVHMERTSDLGATWERTPDLNDGTTSELIQPTILSWVSGLTQILCRSKQAKIFESWMGSDWRTWAPLTPMGLPNPNSAIDAIVLNNGSALLVYNHATIGRYPLDVAVSVDGREWKRVLLLESFPGEYSYPAVIQSSDSLVHITYTWNRSHIRHVVVDPRKLQPIDDRGGIVGHLHARNQRLPIDND